VIFLRINKDIALVCLRNPWGNGYEWRGKWSDVENDDVQQLEQHAVDISDGVFWMSVQDFVKNFECVETSHLTLNALLRDELREWKNVACVRDTWTCDDTTTSSEITLAIQVETCATSKHIVICLMQAYDVLYRYQTDKHEIALSLVDENNNIVSNVSFIRKRQILLHALVKETKKYKINFSCRGLSKTHRPREQGFLLRVFVNL